MSKVDQKQVEDAVHALFAYLRKKAEQSNALIEDDEFVSIIIALKKTPAKGRVMPMRVSIPHSIYKDSSICLFTKDPHETYKKKLEETPVENVEKVMGYMKLRKNYRQFADRRKLLATYDLFMADDRIIPLLPATLGKKFFISKRQPVPVNLKNDIVKEINKACNSTFVHLSTGATVMVKIARSSFNKNEVVENIMGGLDGIISKIPKKWKNVQALYLRTATSVALPFYASLPAATKIEIDLPEAKPLTPVKATPEKKRKRTGLSAETSQTKKAKAIATPQATKAAAKSTPAASAKKSAKKEAVKEPVSVTPAPEKKKSTKAPATAPVGKKSVKKTATATTPKTATKKGTKKAATKKK